MLNPTQPNPPAGSNPFVAKDGTQLDPTAATLTRAIRQTEGGDYNNRTGDKNTSKGAYQFNGGNFESWAKEQGQNPDDFSPENQDKVAYTRIKGLLDKGYTQSQVASIWNSGSPEFEGKKGYNAKIGVNYDVPAYVKKVQDAYSQLSSSHTSNSDVSTNVPGINTAQAAGSTQTPPSLGQQALGVAGKVGDFFFPAVKDVYHDVTGQNTGDNYKTPLQQAGDVGMSALSLIPGLGEAGGLLKGGALLAKGAEAANVASKVARVAKVGGEVAQAAKAVPEVAQAAKNAGLLGKIGKDAALGYGMDVTQKLGQGDTNAGDVLTPGLGTLTGGALGAGGALLDKVGNSVGARVINSLIKPLKKDFSYGKNPGRAVAEEGIVGNSLDDLASNIGDRRRQIGQEISQIGDSVPQLKLNLNTVEQYDPLTKGKVTGSVLKPINDALEQAARTNNPAMFARLQQTKRALTEELGMGVDKRGAPIIASKGARNLSNMGYKGAQELKQHIGDMTQWTGNPSDDKAINAALQSVWKNISETQKKGLASVSPALRARLEKLNERYGDLTSAEVATKYREAIHGRQNLVSLGDKLSAGAGLMTGLMTGTGPIGGGIGAAAMAGASHLLGTTAAKTRIARALAKDSGKQFPGFFKTAATRTAASQN